MLFSNRNEFLRDSSRIEPIAPNICNDIVCESGMTRSSSRLEKKINETLQIPPNKKKKKQFVDIRAIRGLCGIGVLRSLLNRIVGQFLQFFNCSKLWPPIP